MAEMQTKSFNRADEVRSLDKTTVDVVRMGPATVARFTFEPGWRWSECVGPKVGTESCQANHLGAVVSGRMHVELGDGTSMDVGPGDAYVIPPGHDAWVTGDEATVLLECESADTYAVSG
jgi:quercetin dioxygenase-like cupin family protein